MNSDSISLPVGISVIVPVYNSQETLVALLERMTPMLQQMLSAFEVILVNDGSRDKSWEVIESLKSKI